MEYSRDEIDFVTLVEKGLARYAEEEAARHARAFAGQQRRYSTGNNTTVITVRIPEILHAKLVDIAKEADLTRNQVYLKVLGLGVEVYRNQIPKPILPTPRERFSSSPAPVIEREQVEKKLEEHAARVQDAKPPKRASFEL